MASVALLAALAGCTQAPTRPAPAADAPARVSPRADAVLARDERFAVVVPQPGEDLAVLAERYLGDRGRADVIAEFNRIDAARPGEAVAIPLGMRNPVGMSPAGAQAVTILCYHRFGPRANTLTVTPAAFEAQMAYLARNGYTVIPLARLAAFLEGREALPRKSVVITIDDGYRSTYDVAWPVLKRHGFPATLFLYTDFVGAGDALTWAQMKDMAASGLVDVEPHSKSHANLTQRQADESEARYRERMRREIDAPIDTIRDRLGLASSAYAYPYGDVNEAVQEQLRAKGVRLGATVTSGGNPFYAPPYMLRRTMVYGGDDLDAFRAKLVTTVPFARP